MAEDHPSIEPEAGHGGSWRAFTYAAAGTAAVIALTAAAVTFFGSAKDGTPSVSLTLKGFPQISAAAAAPRALGFSAARRVNGNLVADPQLLEDAPLGPLPMKARDGRVPMMEYARPFDRGDKRPKIAIVIGGLDIGASATEAALAKLPPNITLAFAPYAHDIQAQIDRARGGGHEVLLEIPMEPFDFPDSDPGPQALLAAAPAEENLKRLDWALARATGYAGVTNLLGGRFLGEQAAIEPVLGETAKRGLYFFDDGANSNSVALTAARHAKAPLATGTVTIDSVQTNAAIDQKLNALENEARQDGFAIGVGSVYPVTIERVAQWAAAANARGFAVVPVSALAAKPAETTADASEKR